MINHLGSDRFPRLKLGIGNETQNSMVGHVLGKFSTDEQNELENTLATAAEAVQLALSQGFAVAANTYNSSKSAIEHTDHEQEIRRAPHSEHEGP